MNSALFFEKCSKTSDLFIDTYIVETCFQQNGNLHRRNMLSIKTATNISHSRRLTYYIHSHQFVFVSYMYILYPTPAS